MSASSSQALEYLELLPRQTHTKLYEQPATALAVYRCMLPHLAKSIVMAMLYMPHPFSVGALNDWFRPSAKKDKEKSLAVLEQLHIIVLKQDANNQRSYELYPGFQRSLRQALQGSGTHRSFGVPANTPDQDKVSVAFLDEYARRKWENILFYMVGSTVGLQTGSRAENEIGNGTITLLKMGEFIQQAHGRVSITRAGFTFVLQETNAQVWSLLIVYLKHAPDLGMQETEVLSFLFMLGSLELGQDYTTSTLSPTQLQMLEDLSAFGIVYRSSKNASTFYPTRLAVTLTSDAGALASAEPISNALTGSSSTRNSSQQGFIIVETNYRIYAYTSSLLQIAVLSLFTKLTTRFPNLVSGKLTKESITRAVKLGISSQQIISYLNSNAHPQMQKQRPFLPPTVMDQIRLWEYEGERVETSIGYLMKEFHSDAEYRDLANYAESLGVLVWRNDSRKVFFVDRVEQISLYLKKKAQR
ncbi:RNA polymerase II transcription factor-like protein B subunit 2 [Aaosphaeria arxii CBS 175.79]|uniref:RNA polymerase II transcription factor B subunit 2 n=1 Tax=Aaosphaeria arxii CBS 175.79 TaxID=1450172 RepID=A0A6A5XTL1_9PLEO|nr:RNA polymerase II transcription factor-like protein B subunit 2 [Aaosphaeria arxii CBS 175.79]KAF2016246.1 RNA polymerase II transcription factor-like protein B subunit 2 [Aaosphaeria arxii CBS 175.79]